VPSENARELMKFVRYYMLTETSDDKFSVTVSLVSMVIVLLVFFITFSNF
jgi:hypothetical protein